MKSYFILIITAIFLTLVACEKAEETINRLDDVLDTDPYDRIRSKAENVHDEIKGFAAETQEDISAASE